MKSAKKNIFVVDDEADILEILKINLAEAGFIVHTFSSGETAMSALKKIIPDLIIVDVMMSGMDGYDFCKTVRGIPDFHAVPIIFLSAKSEEFDKVLGLELGGDDFITKPFGIKELISRIKAVLRRAEKQLRAAEHEALRFKGVELHPDKYIVTVDGEEAKLTKTEFEILHLFMRYRGKIFTRDNIIDSIRGNDVYVVDRTIDVHVMNLRKKLGPYGESIKTFSGVGYGIKE
ncbi:MAG TPA: response regulator transcription factor [Spirochaetota bacterium]|nr:response regulator transcription factor [Spirochaetota bacterium]